MARVGRHRIGILVAHRLQRIAARGPVGQLSSSTDRWVSTRTRDWGTVGGVTQYLLGIKCAPARYVSTCLLCPSVVPPTYRCKNSSRVLELENAEECSTLLGGHHFSSDTAVTPPRWTCRVHCPFVGGDAWWGEMPWRRDDDRRVTRPGPGCCIRLS